jgi:hypothetical protein
LNNAYEARQKNYPKTVESGVAMLSNSMNDKGIHMTDEDKGQTDQKRFMLQMWQEGSLCKQVSQWGQ